MEKVRISAAHLALLVLNSKTRVVRYFGFLNKGAIERKNVRRLTPPGGVLLALPAGEAKLVADYGAFDWGDRAADGSGVDARFFVEERHVEPVLNLIQAADPAFFEQCGGREYFEELATREIPKVQKHPVLDTGDLETVKAVRLGVYRQPHPDDGVGTSSQASADFVSRRLFFCWGLIVPPECWAKLESSDLVELLTEEEVSTTRGGRCEGLSAKGSKLGDNLFAAPAGWIDSLLAS